jgi:hypothetical protein
LFRQQSQAAAALGFSPDPLPRFRKLASAATVPNCS